MRLRSGRVIGREDFPAHAGLSKQHLRFTRVRRIGWRVRDLDSRHGTAFRAEPLAADRDFVVRRGDRLTIEGEDYVLEQRRALDEVTGAATLLILILVIIDPATSFGRGVGWFGWLTFAASALAAGLIAARLTRRLYAGRWPRLGLGLSLALAVALDLGQLWGLGRIEGVRNRVGRARIEYVCLANFRGRACVQQVEACGTCAHHVEAPRRDLIVQRLVAAKLGRPVPER